MVAIIKCTNDEMEQLNWNELLHAKRGEEWPWQPTRRRKNWESGSHLTLVLDPRPSGDVISKLGWTTRVRRAGDLDQVLEVSRIEPVDPPVPYDNVVRRLAGRFTAHLVEEGQLPERTGRALLDALSQERPALRHVIARIEGVAEKYPIGDSPAGQIMAAARREHRGSTDGGHGRVRLRSLGPSVCRARQ